MRQVRKTLTAESVQTLRTWAALYKSEPVSWAPVDRIIRVAEAESVEFESRISVAAFPLKSYTPPTIYAKPRPRVHECMETRIAHLHVL
jgi:hypothetical protein